MEVGERKIYSLERQFRHEVRVVGQRNGILDRKETFVDDSDVTCARNLQLETRQVVDVRVRFTAHARHMHTLIGRAYCDVIVCPCTDLVPESVLNAGSRSLQETDTRSCAGARETAYDW